MGEFRHHDPVDLARVSPIGAWAGLRPLVVSPTGCARDAAPRCRTGLLEVIRRHRGILAIDDTQALGVLGSDRSVAAPYGHGGGGP